jgi:hypothetical protein
MHRSLRGGRESAVRALVQIAALVLAAGAASGMLGDGDPSRAAERPLAAARPAAAPSKTPGLVQPVAPSRYSVPRPFVRVRTSSQLRAALRRRTPTRIVLERGVYDAEQAFADENGHSLYAARLGQAVLTAGIRIGSRERGTGGLLRGIVIDVRDQAKTVDGVALSVSDDQSGVQVLDAVLRGHRSIRSGLVVRQPEGFRAARLVVRDFTDYGVLVDANDRSRTELDQPFHLRDLDVTGIERADPGSSMGRGEACVWVGNPGTVDRVRARDCGWTGLWTGTAATGLRVADVDVDQTKTGVYLEHFTHDSTFERIRVGNSVRVGLSAEWADPGWGRQPASVDNVIKASRFESWLAGIYLDEGTTRTVVRGSTFVGQQWAGIGDYKGVDNTYFGNDYRGIGAGAVSVTHDHIRTAQAGAR